MPSFCTKNVIIMLNFGYIFIYLWLFLFFLFLLRNPRFHAKGIFQNIFQIHRVFIWKKNLVWFWFFFCHFGNKKKLPFWQKKIDENFFNKFFLMLKSSWTYAVFSTTSEGWRVCMSVNGSGPWNLIENFVKRKYRKFVLHPFQNVLHLLGPKT